MKNKNCPICNKNDMVIKIVYGEPTEETWNKSKKGKFTSEVVNKLYEGQNGIANEIRKNSKIN